MSTAVTLYGRDDITSKSGPFVGSAGGMPDATRSVCVK